MKQKYFKLCYYEKESVDTENHKYSHTKFQESTMYSCSGKCTFI
jgi:hypothetical protein